VTLSRLQKIFFNSSSAEVFLRYPSSAIGGREGTMTGECRGEDYYRELAQSCRNRARGFLALNPVLAELYRTAADVWERLRFTGG
jgi:hypothetical protein